MYTQAINALADIANELPKHHLHIVFAGVSKITEISKTAEQEQLSVVAALAKVFEGDLETDV